MGRGLSERSEPLLLAVGGQTVFACLVALATGVPPSFEATVAFGLAMAGGLELQARRARTQLRPARRTEPR